MGRFRSGSTLVWNLFRNTPGYTAYYEPFHPHLLQHIGSARVSENHAGVSGSYWREYACLVDFESYFDPRFAYRQLSMEEDTSGDSMLRYLNYLIESATSPAVLLQLNRGDFRVRWLKARYPEGKFLHIHRDVRQSWISSRRHLSSTEFDKPTHPDAYELFQWVIALADVFPFLIEEGIPESSFTWHYYLWRLSFLSLSRNCEVSIDYDKDTRIGGQGILTKLSEAGLIEAEASHLAGLIKEPKFHDTSLLKPRTGYEQIEANCEAKLKQLGLAGNFGRMCLSEIRTRYDWAAVPEPCSRISSLAIALLEEYNRTMEYLVKIDNLRRDSRLVRLFKRLL